ADDHGTPGRGPQPAVAIAYRQFAEGAQYRRLHGPKWNADSERPAPRSVVADKPDWRRIVAAGLGSAIHAFPRRPDAADARAKPGHHALRYEAAHMQRNLCRFAIDGHREPAVARAHRDIRTDLAQRQHAAAIHGDAELFRQRGEP